MSPQSENKHNACLRHFWGNKDCITLAEGQPFKTIDISKCEDFFLNPDRCTTLVVREEYEVAYRAICENIQLRRENRRRSSVLVTGQPGIGVLLFPAPHSTYWIACIGKTLFSLYVLIRRIQEEQPVAIQTDPSVFLLFNNPDRVITCSGKITVQADDTDQDPSLTADTWALVNTMGGAPCPLFKELVPQIILFSSPAKFNYNRWNKEQSSRTLVMDLWTWDEFYFLL
jgi:hypothetical protein